MARTTTARDVPGLRDLLPDAGAPVGHRRGRRPARRALVVLLLCCAAVAVGIRPAAAATDVARDGFDRSVASGLGTAEAGGAWTLPRAASDFSVSGGAAHVKVGRGLTREAYLVAVALSDVDAAGTFSTATAPTGSGVYETLVVRRRNGSDYGARLILDRSGAVKIQLVRQEKALKTIPVAGLTAGPGARLRLRVQAEGTNPTVLRARVWRVGARDPSRWQVTASDSTAALQGAGSVGIRSYLSSSATATPVVTDVDDLSATDIANLPPLTAWSTSSPPGLTVFFDGSQARDPDGRIVSWSWTFGDGTTATGPRVSHRYLRPGTYVVTFTVTDSDGASVTSRNDSVIALATEAQWLVEVADALVGAPEYLDSQQSVPHRAIVLDIENTAVSSQVTAGSAVPPVLDLARRARQDGYEVFFATERDPDAGESRAQLTKAGYVVGSSGHICFRDRRVSVEASKTACRAAWARQGFTIVANVGNHQEDLNGPDSGKTYLLPSYGYLE